MLEHLFALDRALFFLIHRGLANRFFDLIFPVITNGVFWIAPAILGAALFWKQDPRRAPRVLLLALLLITVTDPLSSRAIKSQFKRFRPCDPRAGLENVHSLIGTRTSPSFPSSHAVNSFALASFFAFLYPRRRVITTGAIIAALVGFSRVYVGVHFPGDVAAGALMGVGLGLGFAVLAKKTVLRRIEAQP
ncbi:MAG: phosphatase PAP2 family protein [Fibrobacterota bacterium]